MEIAASIVAIVLERKKQGDALRQSDERFRLLFEEATDSKILLSEEGRILDVNHITHERLGYAKAEMLGKLASDFVTPENVDKVAQRLQRVSHDGYATYESAQMRKDGSILPVEISTIVIDLDGRKTYYSILRDITARKNMERALRENEMHLSDILEHAPIGLATVSIDGHFIRVNQSLCEIVGHDRVSLEKLTFQEITHQDDIGTDLENVQRLLSGEISFYKMEKRYIRKDRGTVWVQLTASLLRNAEGEPLHFIAHVEDISERKKIQEQMNQLAYFDTLTDLPNRRFMLEKLDWALIQARRHVRSLAVMFLDLDRFKQVNDNLGHDVGDALLRTVAEKLSACVRKGDIVSRQGGDEFIIVLTEINCPTDATLVAEKIIQTLGVPLSVGPYRIGIGTSIGIAIHPADGDDDALELMKKADRAMYAVKESGRNDYRLAED
jgi:diguanylate cyclase (GGDEF)-like protein/PAS domain S-box-containing protein